MELSNEEKEIFILKPEERAEIILWDWLKKRSSFIEEIFFNRENKLGWKKFRVEGLQKKPDFIFKINDGFKKYYVAVEVKPSENSINILNASKIIDIYLKNYERGETKYFIEGEEIKINYFLIASDSSPKGYLFENETLLDNLKDAESKSKLYVTKIKLIPRYEGNRTFEFVRFLWNSYKERNEELGVGIVINDIETNEPRMMVTSYDKNKKRWSQRWWKI